jgi:hypothetical protein
MIGLIGSIKPWLAIGVIASTAATDAVYVMFTAAVGARRRFQAATWSSAWYLLSAFAVISYTSVCLFRGRWFVAGRLRFGNAVATNAWRRRRVARASRGKAGYLRNLSPVFEQLIACSITCGPDSKRSWRYRECANKSLAKFALKGPFLLFSERFGVTLSHDWLLRHAPCLSNVFPIS